MIAVCLRKLGIKPSKTEEAAVEGKGKEAGKEAAVGGEGEDKSDAEDEEEEEEETGLLMQFVNHSRMKELLKEITAK